MEGLGRYAFGQRRLLVVAAAWAVVAAVLAGSVFDVVKPFGFEDPDSESSNAADALENASGRRVLPEVELLVRPKKPQQLNRAVRDATRELSSTPHVVRVQGPSKDPTLVAPDGDSALVVGWIEAAEDDIAEVGREVNARFTDDRDVLAGGAAVTAYELNDVTEDDLRRIELYAAPVLLLLSLFVFRGVVAALLPLFVGALSILTTLALLRLLSNAIEIDVFAINIVTGLGLGLAIDYSLFIVSRYREELEKEGPTRRALEKTMAAMGRMILFSGLTVAAALASLIVFPQRFLYSVGAGGALVALSSAAVCLLVLPLVLALLGERVNAGSVRFRRGVAGRRWYALGDFVLRHPIPVAVVVSAAMVLAGLPFLRVELTRADSSVLPQSSAARQVDEQVRKTFEVDPSARLAVAILPAPGRGKEVKRTLRELELEPAVQSARGPTDIDRGALRRVDVYLNVEPYSDSALDTVDAARELKWGGKSVVGGPPAELLDQRDSLKSHLPVAIAIILAATVIVLFAMTRSMTLPIVAVLMNMLTVSVAFGVLVLLFQDGRMEDFLSYTSQAALDSSMPILLFAVVFGLSTDYGVFLLQRIREERAATGDDEEAIALGLARSGRAITAAALLFAVAMGAFAFSDLVFIKEVAIGTAVAVLVDAAIVRALLFPALIGLLGSRAWWAPRWLGGRP